MSNEKEREGMLGLFPSLAPIGGVQVSGRLIADRFFLDTDDNERSSSCLENFLLTYGAEGPIAAQLGNRNAAHGSTKIAAIRIALSRMWTHQVIFIWHLHLVRLLPFIRRSRSSRVVVALLGIEAWRRPDPLTKRLLYGVDQFVAISDFTWRRFAEANPELATKPHATVHLGIGEPLSRIPPVSDDPPVVLMVGRLARAANEDKGHRAMIGAWPRVRELAPSAELWIVGDGALRVELEQLVSKNRVSHCVRFFGQVSETEKQDALARCRCFALPSRGEGFGLVYLEAMRMGRPCLVSTVDAAREVVNPPQAGLSANPDDPEELANAAAHLLRDDDGWSTWSRQARARYEQNFTGRHFLDRLGTVLEKQAGKAGSGGIQTCVESPASSSIRDGPTDRVDGVR